MDKGKIKEIIEETLQGSCAEIEGGEGKYTASIIYNGFEGLNTVKRHQLVYSALNSYIISVELHAISLKTFASKDEMS